MERATSSSSSSSPVTAAALLPPPLLHPYHLLLEGLAAILSETPHVAASHGSHVEEEEAHAEVSAGTSAAHSTPTTASSDASSSASSGDPSDAAQQSLLLPRAPRNAANGHLTRAVGRAVADVCVECAIIALDALVGQWEGRLSSSTAASPSSGDADGAGGAAPPLPLLLLLDVTAPAPSISLPAIMIDRPWRPWRGFLLDTARHWMPQKAVYRMLDGMAASGLNLLHWHLVDSQAWPIRLATHPSLARDRAWHYPSMTYGRAAMRAVVRYAADRGIRVLAELDSPSHTRESVSQLWRAGESVCVYG